jgi:Prophage tail length tape measure protein
MSGRLGTLVVRILAEGLSAYKADWDNAAKATEQGAQKIDQSTSKALQAAKTLGGGMQGVAGAATGLASDMAGAAQATEAVAAASGAALLPVAAMTAGVILASRAVYAGSQEQVAYNRALILTNNAAGANASQMQGMARNIGAVVGTVGEAAAALAAMAGSGQVANSQLEKFSQVAVQMNRTMGASVQDTVAQFVQLGEAPVQASLKLNNSLNYLTAATFAQIKAAEDLGDKEAAAALAQSAYANAMNDRTAQLKNNLGTLETAWIAVRDFAKSAWDAMLGVGRQAGPTQALEAAKTQVANLEGLVAKGGTAVPDIQRKLDAAKQNLSIAMDAARLAEKSGQLQAQSVEAEKAKIAWMQEGDKFLDKRQKMEQEISKIRMEGNKAGAAQEEIEKRIADTRAKYADKPGRAGRVDNSAAMELEKQAVLLASLSGLTRTFANDWDRLGVMYKNGKLTLEQLTKAQADLLAKQPAVHAAQVTEAKALEDFNRTRQKANDMADKAFEQGQRELDALVAHNAAQRLHNEEIGLEAPALARLTLARLDAGIALAELNLLDAKSIEMNAAKVAQMERELELLRQKRGLTALGQQKTATAANVQEVKQIGESLQTPEARERAQYQKRLAALFTFRDAMAEAEREGDAASAEAAVNAHLLIEQEDQRHRNALMDMQSNAELQSLGMTRNVGEQLYAMLKQSGQDNTALAQALFLTNKAIAVAEILINTELAAAKAMGQMGIYGIPMSTFIRATGYASAGIVAGQAIAQVAGGRADGGAVDSGRMYRVNERGPELLSSGGKDYLMMGSQGGSVTPTEKLGGGKGNLTIINHTGAPIGRATRYATPDGGEGLTLEGVRQALAADMGDPNSRMSRSMQRNLNAPRSR